MTRGASIDRRLAGYTALPHMTVDSDVRCHLALTQRFDKGRYVVSFVAAQRDPAGRAVPIHEREGRFAFGRAGGMRHFAANYKAVAVLHQSMAHVAEHALSAIALAIKSRVGIRGAGMRLVRALLAAEVPFTVAAAIWRRAAAVLGPKALHRRPRPQERPIDRKVIATQQLLDPRQ